MTNPLAGRHILLGVTGSVAAYKAVDLASKLTQFGALVDVILTQSAEKFVSPLSFQSVTGRRAYTDADLWSGEGHIVHVGLGHPAEMVIIAPVSANTLAKLAHGVADNLLCVSTLAASKCPLLLAPAMDADMYGSPATQANVETLKKRGTNFIGPVEGHLASGLSGLGRFADPLDIVKQVRFIFSRQGTLAGKKVVVTAGGTREVIDPVRMITNRSSGRQGYALAQAALDVGADVLLISAPTHLDPPFGAERFNVNSAAEMQAEVLSNIHNADALIMAAAVADFRPASPYQDKIKKDEPLSRIILKPTEDILQLVKQQRGKTGFPKFVVGFAAETCDLEKNAQKKLLAKGLDLIAANDVSSSDAGFEVESNRVTLLFPDGKVKKLPLQSKEEVANDIISILCSKLSS